MVGFRGCSHRFRFALANTMASAFGVNWRCRLCVGLMVKRLWVICSIPQTFPIRTTDADIRLQNYWQYGRYSRSPPKSQYPSTRTFYPCSELWSLLIAIIALKLFEGRVGAVTLNGDYFITSPNAKMVYTPPSSSRMTSSIPSGHSHS